MVLVVTFYFFCGGLLLTRSAPDEIRWILWLLLATLVLPPLLLGLLLRRIVQSGAPYARSEVSYVRPRTRLLIYAATVLVTLIAANEEAKMFSEKKLFTLTPSQTFMLNAVILAALITVCEWIARRQRRSSNHD